MVIDPEIYAELHDLLGPERGRLWVEGFLDVLSRGFPAGNATDTMTLLEDAHRIGGLAGFVGCMDLVEACQTLQRACRSGADTTAAHDAARSAAELADAAVRRLLNP